MVQIGYITDGQLQDLDLGELLIRRQRGQQFPELAEGGVEGLHPDSLPGGVGEPVLLGGPSAPPPLLPREGGAAADGGGLRLVAKSLNDVKSFCVRFSVCALRESLPTGMQRCKSW